MEPRTIIIIGSAAVVGLIGLIFYAASVESKEWEAFRVSHNCVITEKSRGTYSTGLGVLSNGKSGTITTYTPGKTAWACDDGVTYWR